MYQLPKKKMTPEEMAASGISEPKGGTSFSIMSSGRSPQAPKPMSQNAPTGQGQQAAVADKPAADKPAADKPAAAKPLILPSQNRRAGGFEAFLSRGLALSGTPRMKGGSKKPGFIYREGPFKGLNQGQAEEKARSMYANLHDSVRKKYENRANMLDVRSNREMQDNNGRLGLPAAGQAAKPQPGKEKPEDLPPGKKEGFMETPGDADTGKKGNQGVLAKRSGVSAGTQAKIDAEYKKIAERDKAKAQKKKDYATAENRFSSVWDSTMDSRQKDAPKSQKKVNARRDLFAKL